MNMKRGGLALLAAAAASAVFALPGTAAPPNPAPGFAYVDGVANEWTESQFFADMYRAGDASKKVESKLYLRYDCNENVLYAYVDAVGEGVTIKADAPDDSFIKIGNNKLVDGNSGNDDSPPDFAWVGLNQAGTTAEGWEASASLPKGSYLLNVHTQVEDGGSQTSAVKDRSIPLVIDCPVLDELGVSKTANTSFTRTYDWTITKSASGTPVTTAENTATFTYTVTATKDAGTDSDFRVSGVITVTANPQAVPEGYAMNGVVITDDILLRDDETCVIDGEGRSITRSIPSEGASFNYTCSLPTKADGTNRVTISWPECSVEPVDKSSCPGEGPAPAAVSSSSTQLTDQFDADFAFGEPTKKVNDTVDVTDAFDGGPAALLEGGDDINASKTFTYSRTVNVPASGCQIFPNVATITSPDGLSKSANAAVEACRQAPPITPPGPPAALAPPPAPPAAVLGAPSPAPSPRAALRVDKTGPRAATAGQIVTYTIKVRNRGKAAARNVIIRDILPSGFTLARKVKGATFRAGKLTWRVKTLARGRSKTVRVRFRIDRAIGGRRCNVATAGARGVRTVRDTACTRIAAVAGAVEPAVTG